MPSRITRGDIELSNLDRVREQSACNQAQTKRRHPRLVSFAKLLKKSEPERDEKQDVSDIAEAPMELRRSEEKEKGVLEDWAKTQAGREKE